MFNVGFKGWDVSVCENWGRAFICSVNKYKTLLESGRVLSIFGYSYVFAVGRMGWRGVVGRM